MVFTFARWRDEVWARVAAGELHDRAVAHRLWRLGRDCCRAWRRRARQRVAEEVAFDVAASMDAHRRRRCVVRAWLRHALAAYVGREGAARRALRTWRGAMAAVLKARGRETAADAFSRRRRARRHFETWLSAWLIKVGTERPRYESRSYCAGYIPSCCSDYLPVVACPPHNLSSISATAPATTSTPPNALRL